MKTTKKKLKIGLALITIIALIIMFTIGFTIVFPSCDMEMVNPNLTSLNGKDGSRPAGFDLPAENSYFTITNLPPNISPYNISGVYVWNLAGRIAQCSDYTGIIITPTGTASAISIPLKYANMDENFAETGSYYVSFSLNVDALTQIIITQKQKVVTIFHNGSGVLDAGNLPESAAARYLTVKNLPLNAKVNCFSEVTLYNLSGGIATCNSYENIIIQKGAISSTAYIPLVYESDSSEPFQSTGTYVVTFTCDIDIYTRVIINRELSLTADFLNGAGEFDLFDFFGYFKGMLANPTDALDPVIRANTEFEMNGTLYKSTSSVLVSSENIDRTGQIWLYAVPVPSEAGYSFELSTVAPVFNTTKNAWYNGMKRALYKMAYLKDIDSKIVAKTFINDPYEQFYHYPVSDTMIINLSIPEYYSLSGAGNPDYRELTLPPGGYIAVLKGAGGGGGGYAANYTYDSYHVNGGAGGSYKEFFTLKANDTFILYTGKGGSGGPGSIRTSYSGLWQAGYGGGGGSGTYVYASNGYFVAAGGGGGGGGYRTRGEALGGGNSAMTNSGPGGAGGSIGPGGTGGVSDLHPNIGGGALPAQAQGGGSANTFLTPSHQGYSYSGGGTAGYSSYGYPNQWKNTNGANGQGGDSDKSGSPGGNNRDTVRGGGADGGLSWRESSGGPGGDGSIMLYKIF